MNTHEWYTLMQSELNRLQVVLNNYFGLINASLCVSNYIVHLPNAERAACIECVDCTNQRRKSIQVSMSTSTEVDFCEACFPAWHSAGSIEGNFWSICKQLRTPAQLDIPVGRRVIRSLFNLYYIQKYTNFTAHPFLQEEFNKLFSFMHASAKEALVDLSYEETDREARGYEVVKVPPSAVSSTPDRKGILAKEVYTLLLSERLFSKNGFVVVHSTKTVKDILSNAKFFTTSAHTEILPTEDLLDEVRVYLKDGISFTDAVACAVALSK